MNLLSPEEIAPVQADLNRTLAALDAMLLGRPALHRLVLAGILARGHILLEGLPGLGKTALVKALSEILALDSKRVQFTPDLMPTDILGAHMLETAADGSRAMVFKPGPVFCNLLLADEINRAPAKVQSALLEAMQERQVTIGDDTFPLPEPFLVLATQNPIEQEGTYPLPEAQVDRFLFKVIVPMPSREDELRIMKRFSQKTPPAVDAVLQTSDLAKFRDVLDDVYCDEKVADYILDLVFATREPDKHGLRNLAGFIDLGASPRASINLNLAARANALLHGRAYATPQDVKEIAPDVLRHRIQLSYEAEARDMTAEKIIREILAATPVP